MSMYVNYTIYKLLCKLVLFGIYYSFEFFLIISVVKGNMEIIPNNIVTTSTTTKFYLIFDSSLSKTITCKISAEEAEKSRRKRSANEDLDEKKCPYAEKSKPVLDQLDVISETPESIILSDIPELSDKKVPRIDAKPKEKGEDYHDPLQIVEKKRIKGQPDIPKHSDTPKESDFPDSDYDLKSFDSKVLNKDQGKRLKEKVNQKIKDKDKDDGILRGKDEGILSDEDVVTVIDEKVEKAEKIELVEDTDWKMTNETYNYKPGKKISIFHIEYKLKVEFSFKDEFNVRCVDNKSKITASLHVVAILRPYPNKTNPDKSLQERQFQLPKYYDISPCTCDITTSSCDKNCCCDQDCSEEVLKYFSCKFPLNDTKEKIERQLTGHECHVKPSILCVYSNTTPYVHHFYRLEPTLRTLSDYNNRVLPFRKFVPEFKVSPFLFMWKSRFYKENEPVQLKLNNAFKLFSLPQSFSGDFCVDSPVLFLVNKNSKCRRIISANSCHKFLSISNYFISSTNSSFSFPQKLFGEVFANVSSRYFCVEYENYVKRRNFFDGDENPQFDKCEEMNPETSFKNGYCNNSVIEVDYLIYWRGTRIRHVEVNFVISNLSKSLKEVKQRFVISFRYLSEENSTTTTTTKREKFPSFQPDENGKCSEKITFVEIGQSTHSSCELTMPENLSDDCATYRDILCEQHFYLWNYLEENYKDSDEIVFLKNDTLCNGTSAVYNSCSQFPTETLIKVFYVNLGKMPDVTYFRVIGIHLSFQASVCFPSVGFGKKNGGNVDNGDEDGLDFLNKSFENFGQFGCGVKRKVELRCLVQFSLIEEGKFKYGRKLTGMITYLEILFSPEFWLDLNLFDINDPETEALTYSLTFLFMCFIIIVSSLFLYHTTPIKVN